MKLLEPYRQYFQRSYGHTQYTRDTRPMAGYIMAFWDMVEPGNPYGFLPWRRPDLYGLEDTGGDLDDLAAGGYSRVTIWAPTGMCGGNNYLDFTPMFTSRWHDASQLPILNTRDFLADWAIPGRELGLWYGQANTYESAWCTAPLQALDRHNTTHQDFVFNEIDGAVRVNASVIGLDAYAAMPTWDAYPWLRVMQQHYPGVRFVVENVTSDIMHTLAPMYCYGTSNNAMGGGAAFSEPHHLANFLNPGHETWAAIHEWQIVTLPGYPGGPLTDTYYRKVVKDYATMGYIAHPFSNRTLATPYTQYNATNIWTTDVPVTLQTPYTRCIADVDDGSGTGWRDGVVDADDLNYYIDTFFRPSLEADLDDGTGTNTPDGVVDSNDFYFYLDHFFNGC